jgi:hypothetical protein
VSATPLAQPWPEQELAMCAMRRWFLFRELPEAPELQAAIAAALNAADEEGGWPRLAGALLRRGSLPHRCMGWHLAAQQGCCDGGADTISHQPP